MKNSFLLAISGFLFGTWLFMAISCSSEKKENFKNREKRVEVDNNGLDSLMKKEKLPFYHGVASGDPLQNAVIIWTKVTPELHAPIKGKWVMATDPMMKIIVQSGNFSTSLQSDYTVKIDVTGLTPGTVYYYQFEALGKKSVIGKTKTLPIETEKIKLGFASCSNYERGFFNAYRLMGDDSLDAVIHLGDYIYEYANSDNGVSGRNHLPKNESKTIDDYRTRYAQYRLDEDLQYAHQQHPFIMIYDDHELANNAYEDGAQNHDSTEGDWQERVVAAKKAYYEWMPIRENEGKHYRSFSFGNLANLIMLDTRTDGRSKQPDDVYLNDLDTTRHIMSRSQMNWLKNELQQDFNWNIIGNQILFSNLTVYFSPNGELYDDGWSGYKRDQIELWRQLQLVESTIIVTGDFHSSFVIHDNSLHDCKYYQKHFEFVIPSITSTNYDEDNGADSALIYQKWYEKKNPEIFYSNLTDHGYFSLEITPEKCTGKFIFAKTILEKNSESISKEFIFNKTGLIGK